MSKVNLERYNNKHSKNFQNKLFQPITDSSDIVGKYISNGKINIVGSEWKNLNFLYTPNEIIDSIMSHIADGSLVFPYREISLSETKNAFQQLCNHIPQPVRKADKCVSRYTDYKYEISNLYINEVVNYNKSSNYFQQKNRMLCSHSSRKYNVYEIFHNQEFKNSLRALWSLKMSECTTSTLLDCLRLRDYIASQFNPAIAKSVYTLFNSVDVLDFSSGWGDRLCGAYATPGIKSYTGIDPNTSVYQSYLKQIEYYSQWTDKKDVVLYNLPAEDVQLDNEIVDTVFTSPPYFTAERYTDEDTQSYKRYNTLNRWLEGFLYPTLNTCIKALKSNGYLIINISDINFKNTRIEICDAMNDYIKSQGLHYVGNIGMYMPTRLNTQFFEDTKSIFVEPMWIWCKTNTDVSLDELVSSNDNLIHKRSLF